MVLTKIELQNFRNIQSVLLQPSENFNIIYGDNGSGKTSLLEAIYLLAKGRSFRTQIKNRIIENLKEDFTIFARSVDANNPAIKYALGYKRDRKSKSSKLHINQHPASSIAEFAAVLPVQLINHNSYRILDSGPKYRRQFIDWGVFHMEHQFLPMWKVMQRCLKQRNALLKTATLTQTLNSVWDAEFIKASELLDNMRCLYFKSLMPELIQLLTTLLPSEVSDELSFEYYRGWHNQSDLKTVLKDAFLKDRERGGSFYGAHRFDLKIRVSGVPVVDVLSRGQQKLLAVGMRLAQGILLQKQSNRSCIYLIDDLSAELDSHYRAYFINILKTLDSQVFITGVNKDDYSKVCSDTNTCVFHVKHGVFKVEQVTHAFT